MVLLKEYWEKQLKCYAVMFACSHSEGAKCSNFHAGLGRSWPCFMSA